MESKQPLHPGQVLVNEFLDPNGITQKCFAQHLGWTYARLNEIINSKRGVTADSALSFSEAIPKTTPEYWLNLQRDWDLWHARLTHFHSKPLSDFIKC
jgi:addiction module HigA family antidote